LETYVTSTELKQELRRVKLLARKDVVHILENGHAGYVFCAADVFERKLADVRAKATWEARAREIFIEGTNAQKLGQICQCEYDARVFLTNTAANELDVEYDGDPHAFNEALSAVGNDPDYGLCLEYDSFPAGSYKVLVPPNDILYIWDKELARILVCGFVRSLDTRLTGNEEA